MHGLRPISFAVTLLRGTPQYCHNQKKGCIHRPTCLEASPAELRGAYFRVSVDRLAEFGTWRRSTGETSKAGEFTQKRKRVTQGGERTR